MKLTYLPLLLALAPCFAAARPLPATYQDSSAAKFSGDVNAALKAARADNQEKKFAEAEALMLPFTTSQPELILPWIELGTAQIGLKKYDDAEKSFNIALGTDPASMKMKHSDDFYAPEGANTVAPEATRASRNTAGGIVSNAKSRTPEIKGVSYASLGEIYIMTGKNDEAKKAFDEAVKANPSGAAHYLGNEAIFFFQVGDDDGQLAAAEKAISVDPKRAILYYFKAQALANKATVDPETHKTQLPPGCAEAFRKYLELDPKGQFAESSEEALTSAGLPLK